MNHDDMTSMSLIEYRVRIERAAADKDGEPIYNGTTEHAQIVIETMFRFARERINVLNESLNNKVFGAQDTIEVAEKYLRHLRKPIRILVERVPVDGWDSNNFYRAFADLPNVEIRQLDLDRAPVFDFHFTTADGDSFRFEPDKKEHAAVAAFGNSTTTQKLDSIFESLWGFGKPVEAVSEAAFA